MITECQIQANSEQAPKSGDLEATFQKMLDAEIQSMKESQSQNFRNHSVKIANDFANYKASVDKQMQQMQEEQGVKISQIEQSVDEFSEKLQSKLTVS